MTIGEKLTQLMKEKGLTQAALSKLSGISQSTISDYCNDKKSPTLPNAKAIADVLDVTLDELAGRVPEIIGAAAHFDLKKLSPEAIEEYNRLIEYFAFKYKDE